MKLYQLIATSAMAVLALAGCNKNEAEAPEETNPDAGMKEVSISISGLATKGQITPSEPWVEDIAKIAEFDIYFTSATGAIKYAYTFSESEYSDAYNEFKDGGSVRFIGLKDISKVYVTANTTTKLSVGANISAFGKVLLENYNSAITKEGVLYIGGDVDLTPIVSEPVDGVDIDVTEGDGTMASQSYTANIYLRPVISRIEIGDVYVKASGEYTTTIDEKTYKYTWEGFTPKLIGIYMSNVAGALDPVAHTVSEWFTKPTGTQIANGKWNSTITYLDGTTADFNMEGSGMNVEKVLWYSNYTSSSYGDLFASELGKDETVGTYTHHYYFNGADAAPATCVPFNFFVPFDVTDESMTDAKAIWTGAESAANGHNPALHFQFDFSKQNPDGGTAYSYRVFEVTGTGDNEITKANNLDLWEQLTSRINFTIVSNGIYYANVTSFKEDDSPIDVAPNTIYKLTGVGINPFNLTTGTETVDEDYNIIVKVTTVPYVIKNVTPSFDNE